MVILQDHTGPIKKDRTLFIASAKSTSRFSRLRGGLYPTKLKSHTQDNKGMTDYNIDEI